MSENEFEVLSVIAARKSLYYERVREAFLKSLREKKLLPEDIEDEIKERLRKAISELPNELFISAKEKANHKIYSDMSIDKLDLNKEEITRLILEKLLI